MHADGKPWNSPEVSESFDHVAWWLSAVTALLRGETSAFILAWEECDMHATRDGELIILEERTHHVQYQLPPVCFELKRIAQELLDATRAGAELEMELVQLAEERYPVEWRAIIAAAARSKAGLPQFPAHVPPDAVMEEFARRAWSATGRKLTRLIDEVAREQERRRKADREGFVRQEQAAHLRDILGTLHGGEMSAEWKQLSAVLDLTA